MRKLVALLLVIVLAVGAYLYFGRPVELTAAVAATLSVLRGDVDAQRGGTGDFTAALDGDLFASGDVVRSQQQGRAVLTFFDGSTISVDPGSHVKVLSLARVGSDGIQVTIEQTLGTTWASVQRLRTPDSKFELKTPSMTAVVRGTTFRTSVTVVGGVPTTTLETDEGTVEARGAAGGTTNVTAGTQVAVAQNQPAPAAPQPQPPRPRLQFVGTAGVLFLVERDGHLCGPGPNGIVRSMPRCDVQGQTVIVGDAQPGTYSVSMSGASALTGAAVVAQGLRGTTRDFEQRSAPQNIAVGSFVRTSLPVTIGANGVLAAPGFTPPETFSSICGTQARGRAFASGALDARLSQAVGFAQANRNAPISILVTQQDVEQFANQNLSSFQGGPVTISDLRASIDGSGLHLSAQGTSGPITVPASADVIAGASGGQLQLRLRSLNLGIVPGLAVDQVRTQVNNGLAQFASSFPRGVERVLFGPGCMAIILTTPP